MTCSKFLILSNSFSAADSNSGSSEVAPSEFTNAAMESPKAVRQATKIKALKIRLYQGSTNLTKWRIPDLIFPKNQEMQKLKIFVLFLEYFNIDCQFSKIFGFLMNQVQKSPHKNLGGEGWSGP